MTGAGAMTPPIRDGQLRPLQPPFPAPVLGVSATLNGIGAPVLFAGQPPGADLKRGSHGRKLALEFLYQDFFVQVELFRHFVTGRRGLDFIECEPEMVGEEVGRMRDAG